MSPPSISSQNIFRPLIVALIYLGIATSSATPEFPAIAREIATLTMSPKDRGWSLPHIPPHRTSNDGRIALSVESSVGGAERIIFYLFRPENLSTHFNDTPGNIVAGEELIGPKFSLSRTYLMGSQTYTPIHRTLWDPTVLSSPDGQSTNPYSLNDGYDYYDLEFICLRQHNTTSQSSWWKRPIRIKVANPKTPHASIAEIIHTGEPTIGADIPNKRMF